MLTQRSVLLGTLALTVVIYATGLGGHFIWDDIFLIVRDQRLRSWSNWLEIARNPFWAGASNSISDVYGGTYRPVVNLAFLAQAQLFDSNPLWFHIVSLALHCACVWLFVRWLSRRIPAAPPLAIGAGALLFALHPSRVETVAWVSGSTDLWLVLLVLLGLEAWDRGKPLLAVVPFSLALFAKETAIVLPVLLAVDVLWLRDKKYPIRGWIGVTAAMILALVGRNALVPFSGAIQLSMVDLPSRVLSTLGHTVNRVVFPFPQTVHPALRRYDTAGNELFDLWTIAVGLFTAGVILVIAVRAFQQRPNYRAALSDIMWFVVPLAPTLNFVDIEATSLVSDRFLYWPLMGVAALVTRGITAALSSERVGRRVVAAAIGIGAIASVGASALHIPHFATDHTLWTYEATVDETNFAAWSALTDIATKGGWQEGVTQFCKKGYEAARSRHYRWKAVSFALCQLRTQLEITPDEDQESLVYIRDVYDEFVATGNLHADHPPFEIRLGVQSERHRRDALENPAVFLLPRANAHLRTNSLAEAVAQLEQITKVYPKVASGWSLLALAYHKQGDTEKRDATVKRARELFGEPKL